MRRNSFECFGLGFFTPNTYFYKWCIPFLNYSQSPLLSLNFNASSSSSGGKPSNSCYSSPIVNSELMMKGKNYKLNSASHKIPHPDKVYTGGEDACFIYEDAAIGVADGVGGWAEVGVDSSVYSNALMNKAKSYLSTQQIQTSKDPATDCLQHAYQQCTAITGSSTGIVAVLVGNAVKICNVGDSRGLLLRPEGLKYKVQQYTTEQTYRFNFPYQLGTGSQSTPKINGQKYEWSIQDGDVLVLGSDGLFDNLWNEDVAEIVGDAGSDVDVSKLAQIISLKASETSEDTFTTKTPWAVGAKAAGKRGSVWSGGKLDDITVVVSRVVGCNTNTLGLDAKL